MEQKKSKEVKKILNTNQLRFEKSINSHLSVERFFAFFLRTSKKKLK